MLLELKLVLYELLTQSIFFIYLESSPAVDGHLNDVEMPDFNCLLLIKT